MFTVGDVAQCSGSAFALLLREDNFEITLLRLLYSFCGNKRHAAMYVFHARIMQLLTYAIYL
jgi:hypothetical protein